MCCHVEAVDPRVRQLADEMQEWADAHILGAGPVEFEDYARFIARWYDVPVESVLEVHCQVEDPDPNSIYATVRKPVEVVYMAVTVK